MEKAFHMLTKNPEGGGFACPSNPPLRSKTHTGSSVARHTGFKGSVVCGGRWGVTAGGSGEGPCRGREIHIQIPMGRPSLPRRRGRHARAV